MTARNVSIFKTSTSIKCPRSIQQLFILTCIPKIRSAAIARSEPTWWERSANWRWTKCQNWWLSPPGNDWKRRFGKSLLVSGNNLKVLTLLSIVPLCTLKNKYYCFVLLNQPLKCFTSLYHWISAALRGHSAQFLSSSVEEKDKGLFTERMKAPRRYWGPINVGQDFLPNTESLLIISSKMSSRW